MKIRQIIVLSHWYDKMGICHTETYDDTTFEVNQISYKFDWSWWEKDENANWDDVLISVTWYNENGEEIAIWNAWGSDLRENDFYEVEIYDDYNKRSV